MGGRGGKICFVLQASISYTSRAHTSPTFFAMAMACMGMQHSQACAAVFAAAVGVAAGCHRGVQLMTSEKACLILDLLPCLCRH